MKNLVRFGISMEDDLLHEFDHLIEHKGYTNRSEAIRDIVREKLVEENTQDPSGNIYGALVFMYDHHKRELEKSLSNFQHDFFENIISTSHVHVDHDHCMEVVLLKGKAKTLKSIAERILSFKGVKHGKLTLTASLQPHVHSSQSAHALTKHHHRHA
jgi:CopG family transcriptional regulator, nickel-responsive regulator